MSITSAAKTSRKNRAEIMAEIDFMFEEMKAADVRIKKDQEEIDALSIESRIIMQRTQTALDALRSK